MTWCKIYVTKMLTLYDLVHAGYVPTQRLEWKRYKQYTRNDIMAAIEEVKTGRQRHLAAATAETSGDLFLPQFPRKSNYLLVFPSHIVSFIFFKYWLSSS
jgi:hypothetical protein